MEKETRLNEIHKLLQSAEDERSPERVFDVLKRHRGRSRILEEEGK